MTISDIKLDFRNVGSEWERAHRLMEVLPQAGTIDTINISLNSLDGPTRWLDILAENGFNYQSEVQADDYHIVARRIN